MKSEARLLPGKRPSRSRPAATPRRDAGALRRPAPRLLAELLLGACFWTFISAHRLKPTFIPFTNIWVPSVREQSRRKSRLHTIICALPGGG